MLLNTDNIPKIAVLMTCHNRVANTINCLNKLFKQIAINIDYTIEVYLVDDGSTDGTTESVNELYPEVNIVEGNGNLYWNRGMHTAWAAANKTQKYDYYLWLNDDTYLYEFCLQELLAAANLTQNNAIVCGSIESPFIPGKLTYGGSNSNGKNNKINQPDGTLMKCEVINGNCVLIPNSVFRIVGNLDWRYTHAIGDNDYSLRASQFGLGSFSTGKFIGSCESNDSLPKWRKPTTPFFDRLKNLYSPLGYSHPIEFFMFEKKHFGVMTAVKHYIIMHIKLIWPSIK